MKSLKKQIKGLVTDVLAEYPYRDWAVETLSFPKEFKERQKGNLAWIEVMTEAFMALFSQTLKKYGEEIEKQVDELVSAQWDYHKADNEKESGLRALVWKYQVKKVVNATLTKLLKEMEGKNEQKM